MPLRLEFSERPTNNSGLLREGSMRARTQWFAVFVIASALVFAAAKPINAENYRWPPPPLPGPPYPYGQNYPYRNGPAYNGCPAGYITVRGDICEPYFPPIGTGLRGPNGCPPHYKRDGALCKPTR